MARREGTRRPLVLMAAASVLLVTGGGVIAASAAAPADPAHRLATSSPQSGPQSGPQGSTTVTPAGDAFQGALLKGKTASFSVGSQKLDCSSSSFTGGVLKAPNNVAKGPVSLEISAPTFSDCPTGLVTASLTTNSDNGKWSLALQGDPAGTKATLTIPKAGLVVTTRGLATCTGTIAPDGPVTIPAQWTPGTATSAPQLSFDSKAVPLKVTGGGLCPTSEKTGAFSGTYDITDTASPSAQIAVTVTN